MIKLETIAQRLRHVGSLCTLCMALAASLMVSCVHDKDMLGCPEGEPGTLTLQFKVAGTTAAPAGAATRATLTGENRVDDIAVWLLEKDGDNKCLSFHYIKAEDQSPAEQAKWEAGDFSVKLSGVPPFETVGIMFVTANVADNFLGGVPTSQVGKMPKAIFEGCITKSSHTIPIGTPLPMGVFTAFDNDNALVSPYDVSLGRTVARIKVNLKVDPTNPDLAGKFDLAGAKVTLSNFVEHGIVFFRRNAPSTAGVAFDCFQYEDKSITVKYHDEERNFTLVPGETDRVNVAPLYLNQRATQTFRKDVTDEYDPDRKVTALLHVPYKKNVADADWLQDNYYKVDIYNADESQGQYSRYFIHPNRSYNLSLTIIGLGSDGLKAVIDCVPWDVEDKTVEVGKSFSLSNTEFVTYAASVTAVPFVKMSAYGNKPVTATSSNGVTVQMPSATAPFVDKDILVTMAAGTNTGTVTFAMEGTTSQTINVTRKPQFLAWDEEIKEFSDAKYTDIECVENSNNNTGFKIATAASNYANAQQMKAGDKIESTTGFHLYTTCGFGLEKAPDVASAMFIVNDGTKKTRVLLRRDGASSTLLGNFYVGTFHRSEEIGERIIQQCPVVANKYKGKWHAKVVSGADWIVLDDDVAKITWPNGSVGAETKPLTSTQTTISATNSEVKFRLGLKSRNTNITADYPKGVPRYGLVLVVFTDGAGVNKYNPIFVRQGEEADYVYRPEDVVKAGDIVGSRRTSAVKFLPYNLGDRQKVPVTFPSQVGQFSQFGSSWKTWTPTVAIIARSVNDGLADYSLHLNWTSESTHNNIVDGSGKCPVGYRIPNDGGWLNNGTNVARESEFRQSMFLAPKNGADKTTQAAENVDIFWGFYADGYFDRNVIGNPEPGTDGAGANSAVNAGTVNAAYIGDIHVNVHNYASLFIPNGGQGGSGRLVGVGSFGLRSRLHTATRNEANTPGSSQSPISSWEFAGDKMIAGHPHYLRPVRCVK